MFSVFQTKFVAFRDAHPTGEKVLFVLCLLAFGYAAINFLVYLASTGGQEEVAFLQNTGSILAQKSYGLGLVVFAFVFLFTLYVISFIKSLKEEESWGICTTALFVFAMLMVMLTTVVLQFHGIRIFADVVVITGLIFLGGAVALFSKQSWNMARKTDTAMKTAFYYASVAFPIMYLLILGMFLRAWL